jgi:hypothetical protein
LRVGVGPGRLRGLGVFDRGADLGLGGERDLGDHFAGHRLEHVRRAAGGPFHILAADKMSDLAHCVLPDLFYGKGPQAIPFRQNLLAQRSTARKTSGDKRRKLGRMYSRRGITH